MRTKHLFLLIVAMLSLALMLQPAQAATFKSSGNVNIGSDEVINDDLYISGGTVVIDGRINGDLLVSGGNVTVNGPVRDDLIAAGGTVILNGTVGHTVRACGGSVSVNSNIEEDLVVAGGNVNAARNSVIGRDVVLAAGSARLSGRTGRRLLGSGSDLIIDGRIGGNARLYVDKLTLTNRAVVGGDLTYTSENEANIESGARVEGKTTRKAPPAAATRPSPALKATYFIISFLAAFLFGVVLLLLFPTKMAQISDVMEASPWVSLLIGLLLLIVVPITVIILLLLVITIPLSLTLLFIYILGIYLAKVFVGLGLGRIITRFLKFRAHNIVALFMGLLVLMLLGLIPFIGPVIRFIYVLLGLGTSGLVIYRAIRERSPQQS